MSKVNDAIEQARIEAQRLHESIGSNTAKNHATIRADIQNSSERARELAASLKTLANAQETDAKQHLKDATTALETTAQSAKRITGSSEPDLRHINEAMLVGATAAVRSLSKATAAKRSSLNLAKR